MEAINTKRFKKSILSTLLFLLLLCFVFLFQLLRIMFKNVEKVNQNKKNHIKTCMFANTPKHAHTHSLSLLLLVNLDEDILTEVFHSHWGITRSIAGESDGDRTVCASCHLYAHRRLKTITHWIWAFIVINVNSLFVSITLRNMKACAKKLKKKHTSIYSEHSHSTAYSLDRTHYCCDISDINFKFKVWKLRWSIMWLYTPLILLTHKGQ